MALDFKNTVPFTPKEVTPHAHIKHALDDNQKLVPDVISIIGGMAGVGFAPYAKTAAGIDWTNIWFVKCVNVEVALAAATEFVREHGP